MVSSLDHRAFETKLGLVLWKAMKSLDEENLFECLIDEEKALRSAAAHEIQVRGTRTSFVRCLELVKSDRFESREAAAFILGQISTLESDFGEESIGPLSHLLQDPYYEVRATAIGALGFIAMNRELLKQPVCEIFCKLQNDVSADVREAIANSLEFLHSKKAHSVLEKLSTDPVTKVQNAAKYALEDGYR